MSLQQLPRRRPVPQATDGVVRDAAFRDLLPDLIDGAKRTHPGVIAAQALHKGSDSMQINSDGSAITQERCYAFAVKSQIRVLDRRSRR